MVPLIPDTPQPARIPSHVSRALVMGKRDCCHPGSIPGWFRSSTFGVGVIDKFAISTLSNPRTLLAMSRARMVRTPDEAAGGFSNMATIKLFRTLPGVAMMVVEALPAISYLMIFLSRV